MSSRNIILLTVLVVIAVVIVIFIAYANLKGNVQLRLNTYVVSPGEELTLTIINRSWRTIYFGQYYEIHRFTDDNWEQVPLPDKVWEDILYSLRPMRKFKQTITAPSEPGLYRIIKEVGSPIQIKEGTEKVITVEFTVSNNGA